MLLSGITSRIRASVASLPVSEQPESATASRQNVARLTGTRPPAGGEALERRAAGPAPHDLAAPCDEDDEARLAGRIVEPDSLARDRDRVAEVELLRVLLAAFDIVLADDPEQPDRAVVLVDGARCLAVGLAAAVAVARGEDEHQRAVAPELARRDARAVEQLAR